MTEETAIEETTIEEIVTEEIITAGNMIMNADVTGTWFRLHGLEAVITETMIADVTTEISKKSTEKGNSKQICFGFPFVCFIWCRKSNDCFSCWKIEFLCKDYCTIHPPLRLRRRRFPNRIWKGRGMQSRSYGCLHLQSVLLQRHWELNM